MRYIYYYCIHSDKQIIEENRISNYNLLKTNKIVSIISKQNCVILKVFFVK